MFQGVAPAIITPFNKDQNVDYAAVEKFVSFQLDGGVDAIVVLGTTGEAPTIDMEEREKLVKTVQKVVSGKVPIILGTGANDARKVVKLNKHAEELGVDGLLIVTPYYNKSTQKGLVVHYKYIADKTSLPIILYNVPSRTGVNILPETAVEIFEKCDNVKAIKEASGNISQIAKLVAMKPKEFKLFSGNDDQTLPIIALGGDGVISVFANICPKEMKEIADAMLQKDLEKAQKAQNKYLPLMNALFAEVNPIPVKYAVSQLNYCENVVRLPLVPATESTEKLLQEKMKEIGVL